MSTFNADEYLAALEPPRFILGGREYVGRVLSTPQWLKMMKDQEIQQSSEEKADATPKMIQNQQESIRTIINLMFPRSRWWKLWERRASTVFCKMPLSAQMIAVKGFLKSQERLLRDLRKEMEG